MAIRLKYTDDPLSSIKGLCGNFLHDYAEQVRLVALLCWSVCRGYYEALRSISIWCTCNLHPRIYKCILRVVNRCWRSRQAESTQEHRMADRALCFHKIRHDFTPLNSGAATHWSLNEAWTNPKAKSRFGNLNHPDLSPSPQPSSSVRYVMILSRCSCFTWSRTDKKRWKAIHRDLAERTVGPVGHQWALKE